ncbi:MAG: homocysteine S-methyltransferase family protein [Pirellulales bacterium]
MSRVSDRRLGELKLENLLLDGATGTELNRRGIDTRVPLWSARALTSDQGLQTLRQIHRDYLDSGATVITANTFRTHRRALANTGYDSQSLTRLAVEAARDAIEQWGGIGQVAGSVAPLEDCYRPDLVPSEKACRAEHAERLQHLADAGVDLILIETMNSIREAVIAAQLAVATGLPTWVCFVCGQDGRILSGESLTLAAEFLLPLGIEAMGVNCGPADSLGKPLTELRAICGPEFPLVAYGNIGYADAKEGWVNTDAVDPEVYVRYAERWPAQILGGCCGTTPAHIRRLHDWRHGHGRQTR